jgi:hypothetical protein
MSENDISTSSCFGVKVPAVIDESGVRTPLILTASLLMLRVNLEGREAMVFGEDVVVPHKSEWKVRSRK